MNICPQCYIFNSKRFNEKNNVGDNFCMGNNFVWVRRSPPINECHCLAS